MTIKSSGIVAGAVSVLLAASAMASTLQTFKAAQGQASIPVSTDTLVGEDGKAAVIIIFKKQAGAVAFSTALQKGGGGVLSEAAANSAAKSAVTAAVQQQNTAIDALQSKGIQYQELYRVQRVLNGVAVRVAPADMGALRSLPGVERVEFLPLEHPTTGYNIDIINAPELWEGTPLGLVGMKGENIRIGIIDTGIDYVHPNFGGTGLLAAYQNIITTSTTGVDNSTVFPTAKVVGGVDLAGDAYTGGNAPTPDANPMDCNGHGSHVAGIAAGYGVNNDGSPYAGPWSTVPDYTGLRIAPGVAPKADLYAIRVFGCGGGTNLTVEGIEWAMDPNGDLDFSDRLDVINMSLGSDYGLPFDASALAADNATSTGMIVVASAGNAGDTFFIHGSPAGGNSVIAVASTQDSGQMGPLLVNTPPVIAGYYPVGTAQFGTAVPLAGLTGNVVRVDDGVVGGGTINDGCDTPFTNAAALAGNIALIDRGLCGFKAKAYNAQLNGAVGVIIANVASSGSPTVPPNMANDPLVPAVTIPVVSVNLANGNLLRTNVATLNVTLTNGADTVSSFTSRGPYGAEGVVYLKPDVAAPGSNITSTQTGITCTGTAPSTGCLLSNASGFIAGGASLVLSGTSMASPHVAGLMALIRQLNPSASVEELKALAMNTAAHDISVGPNGLLGTYAASRVGSGRIDAGLAATDKVVAFNADVAGAVSVTFNNEVIGTASITHNVRIENHTAAPQSLTLSLDPILTSPGVTFSIVGSTAISLPASGSVTVQVKMDATGDLMKRSLDPTMAGVVGLFAPLGGSLPRDYIAESASLLKVSKGATELARVPVYMVHRPHSDMAAVVGTSAVTPSGTVNVSLAGTDVCTGTRGVGTCTGNFGTTDEVSLVTPFELQYTGSLDVSLPGPANLQYVGVNYDSTNDEYLFGVSTFGKWGSPTDVAFDICIDTNKDGKYDKVLFSTNTGTLSQRVLGNTGAAGQDVFITSVFTPPSSVSVPITDFANTDTADDVDSALHDNNVIVLGGYAADIGVSAGGASFNYAIAVCPGFNPLCVRLNDVNRTCTAAPGNSYAEIPQTFTYDGANPGITTSGGAFFSPVALVPDIAGTDLAVDYDFGKMSANGSTGTLLLLHHHNDVGTSAEVVVLDDIFHDGFGN